MWGPESAGGRTVDRKAGGVTYIELISVLAVVGLLVSLALPRIRTVMWKQPYKAEARSILQEAKTLEWAYYQEYNGFDTTPGMARLSLVLPSGSHWNAPRVAASGAAWIQITVSGLRAPLLDTDSVWITLSGDGSSGGGASF